MGEEDKHAHRFAVKVPPYSKLNVQGKIFFTQNWCNITLIWETQKNFDKKNKIGCVQWH